MPDVCIKLPHAGDAVAVAISAFASVSPGQAALSRRIGRGCHIRRSSAEGDIALSLFLANEDTSKDALSGALTLAGPYGAIQLTQGVRVIRALCGIDLSDAPGDGDGDGAQWLRSAALGRLQATPFAAATQLTRGAHTIFADGVALQLVVRSAQHAVISEIRAEASAMLAWLAAGGWRSVPDAFERWAGLALSWPVTLASHVLPAAALASVQAGDVIVPATPRFLCRGEGDLGLGDIAARVQYLAPCSLKIIILEKKLEQANYEQHLDQLNAKAASVPESTTTALPGADHDADSGLAAAAVQQEEAVLDNVPVLLEFRMGQISMTFGELRTLAAGNILQINGGSPESVAIVASGRTLGRGELVEVGAQLGIRVVQWAGAC
ncbi:Type III secretion inner membrane protein (YscQ,homologous to flagellar export components) [Collimonas arenae]|uniref:Type III secretion inner membrane protein (YscQ,homologous to flagellar export components) n=1 Tax=Collimonas arenae TaxID=279058 RepID=A0A0A1FA06_9BURK|nr:FliM/FliN family flagellar motor switch protein [Collimonas arenae]AIY39672.1 Type III secretion inner membrane protein (YscQ,homologous to flagellar export components) [Collimonas arenae]